MTIFLLKTNNVKVCPYMQVFLKQFSMGRVKVADYVDNFFEYHLCFHTLLNCIFALKTHLSHTCCFVVVVFLFGPYILPVTKFSIHCCIFLFGVSLQYLTNNGIEWRFGEGTCARYGFVCK